MEIPKEFPVYKLFSGLAQVNLPLLLALACPVKRGGIRRGLQGAMNDDDDRLHVHTSPGTAWEADRFGVLGV